VIDNTGTQLQVCILGVFVKTEEETKRSAFAMIAVREELPTPLPWGTPMWSGLARVVGPKCEGCPWHKLMPSKVPAWSIDDMKSAAAYSNFKESAVAAKLWESVVQYDARVSAPQPSHPLSNMSSKPSQPPQSQSQSPPPPGPALVEPAQIVANTANVRDAGGRTRRSSSITGTSPSESQLTPLETWQGERSAQTAGLQAGSVFVNLPANPPQPPLGDLLASISSSFAETWKTASAANASANAAATSTQQASHESTKQAMMMYAKVQEDRAKEAAERADQATKASQVLAKTVLASQNFQIQGLQAAVTNALMASICGGAGGHAAASFAPPQAQLGAPAQPQSTEAGISSWLKSKQIAHDDEVVEKLVDQGVAAGEHILLMNEQEWKECGFKPVALRLLAQEKAASK
jgi:hypothetical protein